MDKLEILNKLINEPGIREHVAPGFTDIDMKNFFKRPGNFMFGDEDGVVLLCDRYNGTYEIHFIFSVRKRGAPALAEIRRAFHWAFTSGNAEAIVGETPCDNLHARIVNRALGGVAVGDGLDSLGRRCTSYRLSRRRWAALSGAS